MCKFVFMWCCNEASQCQRLLFRIRPGKDAK